MTHDEQVKIVIEEFEKVFTPEERLVAGLLGFGISCLDGCKEVNDKLSQLRFACAKREVNLDSILDK